MPMMQQPEAYIGKAYDLFNEKGDVINPNTRALLQDFIQAYSEWVHLIQKTA